MSARRKQSRAPSTLPAKVSSQPTEFEQLLIVYLKHIEQKEKELVRTTEEYYQDSLKWERSRAEFLKQNKEQVLTGLRGELQKRKGRLNFMGECYETRNPFVVGLSDVSADIVSELHGNGAFTSRTLRDIVGMVGRRQSPHPLAPRWITFLEGVLSKTEDNSERWRDIVKLLYAKGGRERKYYDDVYQMAKRQGDPGALSMLLFVYDVQTGRPKPRVTLNALALAGEFASDPRLPPLQKITCAHYAFLVRDYELAHGLCESLLTQHYKTASSAEILRGAGFPAGDIPLSIAKNRAMHLLFYGLKNERGLRAIYHKASVREVERHRKPPAGGIPRIAGDIPRKAPTGEEDHWVSYESYTLGASEVSRALGYLKTVKSWAKRGKKGTGHFLPSEPPRVAADVLPGS